MSYLILQIILCLAAAALLGVLFGWLLARRGSQAAIAEEREARGAVVSDWQSRHQEALDLSDAARKRISSLESDLDILRGELQAKSERAIQLETQIARGSNGVHDLEESIAAGQREADRLKEELATALQRLTTAGAALADKDVIIAQLQTGLAERDKQIPDLQTRAASVAELEAQLHAKSGEVSRCSEERGRLQSELAELQSRSDRPAPAPTLFETPGRDDLKRIRGIGPKLERLLNEMDIYSYRQIAGWSEEEIDAVQAKLEEFPGRIRRDKWIEGARTEHRKKFGEAI